MFLEFLYQSICGTFTSAVRQLRNVNEAGFSFDDDIYPDVTAIDHGITFPMTVVFAIRYVFGSF